MAASTCLLLNSTYEPLKVISWERAVSMLYVGKVEIVRTYQKLLRAVSWSLRQPAVVRLVDFVRRRRVRIAFSRRNIFLRDDYTCQYCGQRVPTNELTCDHVLPRSRGGGSTWENLVAACGPCNRRKGNRTPDQARMKLRSNPQRPQHLPHILLRFGGESAPTLWHDFLPEKPKQRHS